MFIKSLTTEMAIEPVRPLPPPYHYLSASSGAFCVPWGPSSSGEGANCRLPWSSQQATLDRSGPARKQYESLWNGHGDFPTCPLPTTPSSAPSRAQNALERLGDGFSAKPTPLRIPRLPIIHFSRFQQGKIHFTYESGSRMCISKA